MNDYDKYRQMEANIWDIVKRFFRIEAERTITRMGFETRLVLRLPRGHVMGIAMFNDDLAFMPTASTYKEGEILPETASSSLLMQRISQRMVMSLMDGLETWILIAKDELKFDDILRIRDIEQRMVALKRYGVEKILHDANAEVVHKSARGNELYLIPFKEGLVNNVFSQDAYFLKYSDPSTGRIYISGVPPQMGETKDADACMAWKHGLSVDAYKLLFNEA